MSGCVKVGVDISMAIACECEHGGDVWWSHDPQRRLMKWSCTGPAMEMS